MGIQDTVSEFIAGDIARQVSAQKGRIDELKADVNQLFTNDDILSKDIGTLFQTKVGPKGVFEALGIPDGVDFQSYVSDIAGAVAEAKEKYLTSQEISAMGFLKPGADGMLDFVRDTTSYAGVAIFGVKDRKRGFLQIVSDARTSGNNAPIQLICKKDGGAGYLSNYIRNWGGKFNWGFGSADGFKEKMSLSNNDFVVFGRNILDELDARIQKTSTNGLNILSTSTDTFGEVARFGTTDSKKGFIRFLTNNAYSGNTASIDIIAKKNGGAGELTTFVRNWGGKMNWGFGSANGFVEKMKLTQSDFVVFGRNILDEIDAIKNNVLSQSFIDGIIAEVKARMNALGLPTFGFISKADRGHGTEKWFTATMGSDSMNIPVNLSAFKYMGQYYLEKEYKFTIGGAVRTFSLPGIIDTVNSKVAKIKSIGDDIKACFTDMKGSFSSCADALQVWRDSINGKLTSAGITGADGKHYAGHGNFFQLEDDGKPILQFLSNALYALTTTFDAIYADMQALVGSLTTKLKDIVSVW